MHRSAGIFIRLLIIFAILVIIAGGLIYLNQGSFAAYAFGAFVERQSESLGLDEADQSAMATPFEELGRRTAEGDISTEQLQQVLGEFAHQPAAGVLTVRGFTNRHIKSRDISAEQLAADEMTCSRFSHAISQGQVNRATIEQLASIAVVDEGNGKLRLKEELSEAEIAQCLQLMQQGADQAAIPAQVEAIDLGSLIEQDLNSVLIEKGLPH